MHKTMVNSDEFTDFRNPIPNVKVAKTQEHTTFSLSNFSKTWEFGIFLIFVRRVAPDFLAFPKSLLWVPAGFGGVGGRGGRHIWLKSPP